MRPFAAESAMFKGIRDQWRALEDCVIRPPRAEYELEDLVGGRGGKFAIGHFPGRRLDLEIPNKRGQTLKCSWWRPRREASVPLPCVVYCHCNSGSRCDANEVVAMLVPQGITVFALDFAVRFRHSGRFSPPCRCRPLLLSSVADLLPLFSLVSPLEIISCRGAAGLMVTMLLWASTKWRMLRLL